MKTIRITAWRTEGGKTFATDEARRLITTPTLITNYVLQHDNGERCTVDLVTWRQKQALALIPLDSPAWTEGIVDSLFDDAGHKRPGVWKSYEARVRELEGEGMSTSDAQSVADLETTIV
jgi:hypothetical protein